MRKITSLLMLLVLFAVAAWGQTSITDVSTLSNSKVYYLKSERGSLVYNEGNPNVLCSTRAYSSIGAESEEAKWAVYKYKENYYFYSIAGGKFVGKNDAEAGRFPLGDASEIFIVNSTKTNYPFVFSTDNYGAINHFNKEIVPGVANWKGNDSSGGLRSLADDGSAHMIIEAGDLDEATQKLIETKIDAVPVLAEVRSIISDAITVGKTDAYLDVTALSNALKSYETEASTDNFTKLQEALGELKTNGVKGTVILSEGDKFRIKAVDSSRGYVVYSTVADQGSETTPILANASGKSWSPSLEDEGVYSEWAFIEYEGSRYLYNVQKKAFIKPVSGGVTFEFTTAEPAIYQKEDKGECKWAVKFGSQYMECSPGYGLTHAVRQIGTANDQGSWFYLEKTNTKVDYAIQTDMTTLIENYTISVWKEEVLSSLGYIGGYDQSLESEINAITDKAGKDDFVKNHSVIALTEGYYFLKSKSNQNTANAHLAYTREEDGTYRCDVKQLADGQAPAINNIWKLVACDTDTDKPGYKFCACNPGTYMVLNSATGSPNYSTVNEDFTDGHKFTFEDQGMAEFIIKNGDDKVMRTEGDGRVNYWDSSDLKATKSTWYIIPAEDLNVVVDQYATIYLPFDVTLPEGLHAYAVTNTGTSSATMMEMADIPANTGAILEGNGSYKLSIEAATSNCENKLKGSNVPEYVAGPAYILSDDGNGGNIGLYRAMLNKDDSGNDGKTCFLNNANKAYLLAEEGGSRVLFFNFGTETGIDGTGCVEETIARDTVIYDLSGRRVQSAQRGIYIVNGKKVVK